MKDIIANRRKVRPLQKFRLVRMAAHENGVFWTINLLTYYATSWIADRAYTRMNQLRVKNHLPGLNSTAMNREIWQNWDWQDSGEEWTESAEWKQSLISNVLQKHMLKGGNLLEVGPGAGRWTETLQQTAGNLIAVDISDQCIDICKRKFADCNNVEFFVNNGTDLSFVQSDSIDSIWSFDVFVHINADQIESYMKEFNRLLKPGATAVIHHGHDRGRQGGWRSDVTSERFVEIVEANGLQVEEQIAGWWDGERYHRISVYGDVITIFRKKK
jgi:ubiquinone/menaquinone biosynthesis C-methylase UbiE